jgi:hypothetical protein
VHGAHEELPLALAEVPAGHATHNEPVDAFA